MTVYASPDASYSFENVLLSMLDFFSEERLLKVSSNFFFSILSSTQYFLWNILKKVSVVVVCSVFMYYAVEKENSLTSRLCEMKFYVLIRIGP